MINSRSVFRRILFTMLGCAVLLPASLLPTSILAKDNITKLTIHPSALPVPAMKYRLMTPSEDLKSANASLYYQRALVSVGPYNPIYKKYLKQIEFLKQDYQEIKKSENDHLFTSLKESQLYYELERAAVCNSCAWEIPFKKYGIETLLTDVNELRHVSKIIASLVRWHIAKGEYEEAIIVARKGVILAQNLSKGNVGIISNLVGFASLSIINNELRGMMSQPDSPNLYWALTEVSHEKPQHKQSIELEKNVLLYEIPTLKNIDKHVFSKEESKQFKKELIQLHKINEGKKSRNDVVFNMDLMIWSLNIYPFSEKFLLGRGYSQEKLDSMPTLQVVFLGQYLILNELYDDHISCFLLEPHLRLNLLENIEKKQKYYNSLIPQSNYNLNNFQASTGLFLRALFRHEQRINILRTVELIRDYLSRNQKLPTSLEELDHLLLPVDPVTGKPFRYQLNGKTALIQSAEINGRSYSQYELQVAD